MKVTLRAHGLIKVKIGSGSMEFVLPDDTQLIDFLNLLAETVPDNRLGDIWDRTKGRFLAPVFVMVEKREVQDFSLRLKDGQEISLVSPMAGG